MTTILVLRGMSRRSRAQGEVDDAEVPYGPDIDIPEPEAPEAPEVPEVPVG